MLVHLWVSVSLSAFLGRHGEIAIHHVIGNADCLIWVEYELLNYELLQRFILNFKRPSRPHQLD